MKGAKTALITGATSGIGKAFAEELAARGYELLITGRRAKEIRRVAAEIGERHGVKVKAVIAELANEKDVAKLLAALRRAGNVEILVNNAGYGEARSFLRQDAKKGLPMVKVHVTVPLRLMGAVLPGMIRRGRGAVINVSSMSAFLPFPGGELYAGTKSFLHVFSTSLSMEAREHRVKVQSLCPGFTRTDFHKRPGLGWILESARMARWMEARDVVRASLKALEKGRVLCVPGFLNKLVLLIPRFMPFGLYLALARKTAGKPGAARI